MQNARDSSKLNFGVRLPEAEVAGITASSLNRQTSTSGQTQRAIFSEMSDWLGSSPKSQFDYANLGLVAFCLFPASSHQIKRWE
jgi:hypothetical protein